jgi:DNA replication and repair protein RecF
MTPAGRALPVRELRLRQFRNFAALDLEIPAEGMMLIGENGAGKTNLLEAIYYLEILRSFRGATDAQLVRFGAEAFHIRARLEGGVGVRREVSAAFEPRTQKKRVTVDGREPERIGAAIGHVGVVVFSPADVAIVAGSPGERRRFLDIVLSLSSERYLAALQRYRATLRQRNALLKGGAGGAALAAWNDGLVQSGAVVTALRAAWVAAHAAGYSDRYRAISGGAAGELALQPSLRLAAQQAADEASVAEHFVAELARVAPRERERGMTLIGPHRDDLIFTLDTAAGRVDLREYGSGGQRRTAAIALRMVEASTLREVRGGEPTILLDDVFAELDEARSRRVLELLEAEQRGQVVLTAPKESDVRLRGDRLVVRRIHAGQVSS